MVKPKVYNQAFAKDPYAPLYSVSFPIKPDEVLFTPMQRAAFLTFLENNIDRCSNRIDWRVENVGGRLKDNLPKKDTKVLDTNTGKYVSPGAQPLHDAKFSRQDTGQNSFGSYTEEGQRVHKQNVETVMAKLVENKKNIRKLDRKVAQMAQEEDAATNEDEEGSGKKRKRGVEKPVKVAKFKIDIDQDALKSFMTPNKDDDDSDDDDDESTKMPEGDEEDDDGNDE
jgi:hypothetical protein